MWSPDGSRLIFDKPGKDLDDLFQKASAGSGSEHAVLEDPTIDSPRSWSADGRFLLYQDGLGPPTGIDLLVLPLVGDRKPFPYLQTRFDEFYGNFSPDGRWVAYASGESGRTEVYVAAFPGAGSKRQISTAGGSYPRWRRDGKEIFWLAPENTLMAAPVNGQGASVEVGSIQALFKTTVRSSDVPYDVSPDGQRFLMITAPDDAGASSGITVVVNWAGAQKK